jgi:hypothetical protein
LLRTRKQLGRQQSSHIKRLQKVSLPQTQKRLTDSGESADSRSNERSLPIDLVRDGRARQLAGSFASRSWAEPPQYIIRDRDGAYGHAFIRRLGAMGIRDRPISARSPWQNGYAERLIGSIRRDCLDHVVVFGEQHLRHLLNSYQEYYNKSRTHLSLKKDAPIPRDVQSVGRVLALPIFGALHHRYVRV